MNDVVRILLFSFLGLGWFFSCAAVDKEDDAAASSGGSVAGMGGAGGDVTSSGGGGTDPMVGSGGACGAMCSPDLLAVVDCQGTVLEACSGGEGCDTATGTCINGCQAAENNKHSVGCSYYATDMESFNPSYCFAAFVANTWNTPAHISVAHQGIALDVENFTRIPTGSGQSILYQPYDPVAGLAPGEVAVLFLSGVMGAAPDCPVSPALQGDAGITGTGVGQAFLISSDVPVVAYQINPYGGGSVAVTGASLLLPTSAWDVNYITVNAYPFDLANPSMNIVAAEDNTSVTLLPIAAIEGGNGIPSGPANQPVNIVLHQGQVAQISQVAELTGSVLATSKPVGLMAGQPCMQVPAGTPYCDHAEQMVPPVQLLGHEYVGVMHRQRGDEPAVWRIIGAADGTQLTYSSDVGGPPLINRGQVVEFVTEVPFVVSSQDSDHPFLMFTYMASATWSSLGGSIDHGDADFVLNVPPAQYLNRYVFFTDPTYPETNLVVVRTRDGDGNFSPVLLDCAGPLSDWQSVGDYEWTRFDLATGNFSNIGNCSNGRHEISSAGRFGLTVWGWGTPMTSPITHRVSYGYPGGMGVEAINTVVIPPTPN